LSAVAPSSWPAVALVLVAARVADLTDLLRPLPNDRELSAAAHQASADRSAKRRINRHHTPTKSALTTVKLVRRCGLAYNASHRMHIVSHRINRRWSRPTARLGTVRFIALARVTN
jgi:hypothetical protein